jgi:V8-like Glu-specific endopeptidase
MPVDTTKYPYTTVVEIDSRFPDGSESLGSGVMVGPDEVLTAAHMVWHQGIGSATSVTVAPDRNQNATPYGVVDATNWHYFQIANPGGVQSAATTQDDIALVHLSKAIGNTTGWMGIQSDFLGGSVHVTGYPSSLNGINYSNTAMIDRVATGAHDPSLSLLDFPPNIINNGDSGGPIWEFESGNKPYVVGIVSSSNSQGSVNPIITTPLLNDIKQWAALDHSFV